MGLRTAAELRRDGEAESSQAIIEAMGCTPLKHGKKRKSLFCYDELGSKYKMPMLSCLNLIIFYHCILLT